MIWERQPGYAGPERRKARRWQPRRGRYLIACLVLVALGYLAAVAWLMSQETRVVFQAGAVLGPGRPDPPYEQVDVSRADGARQFGWVIPRGTGDTGLWVLYLHGNATSIASQVNLAHYQGLRSIGLNVFAPEYRGFGGLDGVPTEAALAADARAAYEYLRQTRRIPANRLVIYGWSLGGAVAIRLAPEVGEAAVVLEASPASMVDRLQRRYPFVPMRIITRNPFDAIAGVDRIKAPILFLHSPEDAVIPIADSRRLFDAARAPKTFVEVRGGHVASEVDGDRLFGAIAAFLKQSGAIK